MTKAIHLYARCSDPEQETTGIQLERMKAMYPADTTFTTYEEHLSGWDEKHRPEYEVLKRRIAQYRVAEVCFYSVSRMGRNVQEAAAFMTAANQQGVRVKVCCENLDFGGPMGYAMFVLFSALAEMESNTKSKRTRDTFARQKRLGTFKPHGNVKGIVNQRTKDAAVEVYAMHDRGCVNRYIGRMLGLTERTVSVLLERRGETLLTRAEYAVLHPDWADTPREQRTPASGSAPKPSNGSRKRK